MATMGRWSERTINNLRSLIGEQMLGQLIEAETLFYVLKEMGLSNGCAKKFATHIFKGGRLIGSNEVSYITTRASKSYQLNPRQASRFMKMFMKGSRIEIVEERPYVWEMNGFGRQEPPYIAGYERGCEA